MAAGIRTETKAPAMTAGRDERGEIAVGFRADMKPFELVDAYLKTGGIWVQDQRAAQS